MNPVSNLSIDEPCDWEFSENNFLSYNSCPMPHTLYQDGHRHSTVSFSVCLCSVSPLSVLPFHCFTFMEGEASLMWVAVPKKPSFCVKSLKIGKLKPDSTPPGSSWSGLLAWWNSILWQLSGFQFVFLILTQALPCWKRHIFMFYLVSSNFRCSRLGGVFLHI